MGNFTFSIQGLLSILLLALLQTHVIAVKKHYIVYLGSGDSGRRLLGDPEDVIKSHHDMISSVSKRNGNDPDSSKKKKLIYSYTKVLNGFAATLDQEEAKELREHPNVISIFENRYLELHTTRSWDFLDSYQQQNVPRNESIWEKAAFGEDVIIGNIDTGVWPESKSFTDEGYGPIPKKFKGHCANENDPTFKCNRKLIGARYFYKGLAESASSNNVTVDTTKLGPRDMHGHGTHTLSIAAGNVVPVSSSDSISFEFLDIKNAIVKGGAHRARVVAYKITWKELKHATQRGELIESSTMDLLAAIDAAIADGVDIINLSMGSNLPKEIKPMDYYLQDAVSIASFHAMAKGVLFVAGVGNEGPNPNTLNTNVAPWLLTVGASTSDRKFMCYITLGNHQNVKAARFLDPKINQTHYPLIRGVDARINGADLTNASYCLPGTLDPVKVKGRILVCFMSPTALMPHASPTVSQEADKLGAVGMIAANDQVAGSLLADAFQVVATAHITYKDAQTIFSYINSTRTPTALITGVRTELGFMPAPMVSPFSSRGPNTLTPEIFKPDVMAPGASIIAAYSQGPQAQYTPDTYFPVSGTSMAAPHVTAIAALLKKLYPHWSPSAIKSAIITTANPLDNSKLPILEEDMVHESTPFGFGAGLVQPNQAMDPGLVYDMTQYDYIDFLCAHNANTTSLKEFTDQYAYKCPKSYNLMDFNYPIISIPDFSGNAVVTRRLKNVAQPATYMARIDAPPGISIVVEPKTLVFSKMDQEIKFKLVFSADVNHLPMDFKFGNLVWSDGKHVVRTLITINPKAPMTANTPSKLNPLKH